MSHSNGYTPRKDGDLLPFAELIETTARANKEATKWYIPVGLIDELRSDITAAQNAWNANATEATRNHQSVVAKDAAFVTLRRYLSLFINYLEGNPKIPDEALVAMGLRPRHSGAHEPRPVPTVAPVVALVSGQHHDIDIYLYNNQAGHPTTYLADPDHAAALIQYKFEESVTLPTAAGEVRITEVESAGNALAGGVNALAGGVNALAGSEGWEQVNTTRKHYTLIFDDGAEGRHLLVRAAWLNPRLQPGPWSDTDRKLIN
jgi:hypothetical protein